MLLGTVSCKGLQLIFGTTGTYITSFYYIYLHIQKQEGKEKRKKRPPLSHQQVFSCKLISKYAYPPAYIQINPIYYLLLLCIPGTNQLFSIRDIILKTM